MPATLIIFESPGRTAECLSDLASGLGDRPGVVARELTKRFEEIVRAPLATLAADPRLASPKGEIVILIGPPEKREQVVSEEEIRAALEEAMATASVRDAVRSVAEHLGVPKSRTYDLAVAVKRARDDGAEE